MAKAALPKPEKKIKPASDEKSRRRVLIVDDHPIFRDGISQLISQEDDLEVCGGVSSAPQALSAVEELNPDMLVVDISIQGTNGIELMKAIRAQRPTMPVLIASMHDENIYAERALRAGARGYIMKSAPSELVIEAIRKILEGDLYLSKALRVQFLNTFFVGRGDNAGASTVSQLSDRDISAKQLNLDLSLEATDADTEGDMVRLQQAFWNVIRNAVKFTPAGGRIAIRSRNTNGGQIEFEVSDTGIGFGPDASARLFAAFEQESESVTRRFGGLGLGLAISKSVLDAHGGFISGSSLGEGKGATFTIRLPLNPAAPAIAMPSGTVRGSSDSKTATRLRLLLVEDHNDTSQTMQALLRRIGHEVTPADSAQSALKLASEAAFDVVISDLGLPDMSGLTMMELMRDRHGLKGIAVSGFGSDEDIAGSRAAGFTHHLTKPISFEKLAETLRDFP